MMYLTVRVTMYSKVVRRQGVYLSEIVRSSFLQITAPTSGNGPEVQYEEISVIPLYDKILLRKRSCNRDNK